MVGRNPWYGLLRDLNGEREEEREREGVRERKDGGRGAEQPDKRRLAWRRTTLSDQEWTSCPEAKTSTRQDGKGGDSSERHGSLRPAQLS